jgi:DNA-binding SARP family transcriptional activator
MPKVPADLSGQGLFRILGPLEAWTGQGWTAVPGPKPRSLLAALLLQPGQPVSTGLLEDEIWPEERQLPRDPVNLIRVYVHRIRKLIRDAGGTVLVTQSPGYLVTLRPGELDAHRFSELTQAGRNALSQGDPGQAADLLDEALSLWRGRPLADVPATPRITAEADRLEESRLTALELRAEARLALGEHAPAVPELRRLAADWPLRENLWALLIRALTGAGRQAEALEAYEKARNAIAEELGVDPGPELQTLYHQILAADRSHVPATLARPSPKPSPSASATPRPAEPSAEPPRRSAPSHTSPAQPAATARPANPRKPRKQQPPAAEHPDQALPDIPGHEHCPDPLQAHTAAEFMDALRDFRAWAGDPSFRQMAQRAADHGHRKASAATMHQALGSDELPRQEIARAIIIGCGGTREHEQAFVTAWRALRLAPGDRPPKQGRGNLYPVPDTA